MIYIIIFTFSLLFLKLSLKCKKMKVLSNLLLIISIFIPCWLAGARDYTVGKDINIYIYPLFLKAKNSSFIEFVFNNSMMNDYLYLALTFVICKIFNSMFALFFVIQLIIIISIYKTLKMNCSKDSQILVGMLIMYSILYNTSFNMTRQSISLAISILSLSYLINQKRSKFWKLAIITFLFHWSGIVLSIIYFIYKTITSQKLNSRKKFIIKTTILLMTIIIIFILPNLLGLLKYVGVSQEKISSYSGEYVNSSFDSGATFDTIFFILIYILFFIFKKNLKHGNYNFFSYLLLMGLVVMQFGGYIRFGYRLSYYFIYPILFIELPKLIDFDNSKPIFLYKILIITIFCFYWYYWNILLDYHETIPYLFYGKTN